MYFPDKGGKVRCNVLSNQQVSSGLMDQTLNLHEGKITVGRYFLFSNDMLLFTPLL